MSVGLQLLQPAVAIALLDMSDANDSVGGVAGGAAEDISGLVGESLLFLVCVMLCGRAC